MKLNIIKVEGKGPEKDTDKYQGDKYSYEEYCDFCGTCIHGTHWWTYTEPTTDEIDLCPRCIRKILDKGYTKEKALETIEVIIDVCGTQYLVTAFLHIDESWLVDKPKGLLFYDKENHEFFLEKEHDPLKPFNHPSEQYKTYIIYKVELI